MKTETIAQPVNAVGRAPRLRAKRRILPLEYTRWRSLQVLLAAIFIFLYFPIVSLVAFSFNNSKRNVTWQGFTFDYYVKAYHNAGLHEAFIHSMIIASVSTLVSTIAGAMLGLALYRFRFGLKGFVDGWISLPIVIPEVCMGVAMLAFFALIDFPLGLTTIIVSHIAFSIPFVAVVIRARMAGFDESLEEASRPCGL